MRIRFTTSGDNTAILAESQQITILSATGTLPPSTATATGTGGSSGSTASANSGQKSGVESSIGRSVAAFGIGVVAAVAVTTGLLV
jgi:hypothetical protein